MADRSFVTCRRVTGWSLSLALAALSSLAAQRRTAGLPRPDSSRAPLLTSLPPDSIRHQVGELLLSQLLMNLQRGQTRAVDVALSSVEWDPADQAAMGMAHCQSVGTALSAISALDRRGLSDTAHLVPVFFSNIQFKDSASVSRMLARITVLSGTNRRVDTLITMQYDQAVMRWSRADGLLAALCAAAN